MTMTIRETWDTKPGKRPATKAGARSPNYKVTPQPTQATMPAIEDRDRHQTPYVEAVTIRGTHYGVTQAEWNALKRIANTHDESVDDFVMRVCQSKPTVESIKAELSKQAARNDKTLMFHLPEIITRNKFGRRG